MVVISGNDIKEVIEYLETDVKFDSEENYKIVINILNTVIDNLDEYIAMKQWFALSGSFISQAVNDVAEAPNIEIFNNG